MLSLAPAVCLSICRLSFCVPVHLTVVWLICLDQSGLPSNVHTHLLCHFPLTTHSHQCNFPSTFTFIHAASWLPFSPSCYYFPISCRPFLLNTEWPLLVENMLTGSNGTSFSSLGDLDREIRLALATLWQTLCLGAIFAPCSLSLHLGSSTSQQVGLVSLLHSVSSFFKSNSAAGPNRKSLKWPKSYSKYLVLSLK